MSTFEKLNDRRHALIEKKIAGRLTETEKLQLAALQNWVSIRCDRQRHFPPGLFPRSGRMKRALRDYKRDDRRLRLNALRQLKRDIRAGLFLDDPITEIRQ